MRPRATASYGSVNLPDSHLASGKHQRETAITRSWHSQMTQMSIVPSLKCSEHWKTKAQISVREHKRAAASTRQTREPGTQSLLAMLISSEIRKTQRGCKMKCRFSFLSLCWNMKCKHVRLFYLERVYNVWIPGLFSNRFEPTWFF